MGELLTATEASRRYSISERTIRSWIRVGKLDARKAKIDGLDSWQIDTDEIEKAIARKKAGKLNASTLPEVFARMEALESRLSAIEEMLATMTALQPQEPAMVTTEATMTHAPPMTEGDLISFVDFYEVHGISESTARRELVKHRDSVTQGKRKIAGKTVEQALDATGRHVFYEVFKEKASFRYCPSCPH